MTTHKILSQPKLLAVCRRLRQQGQTIAFTNGTFDILHTGHVAYLERARRCGDVLVVGVNSDVSVKSYKNPDRPVNPEKDRLRVLAALECVSYVTLFGDPTPLRLIQRLRPDRLIKGADWKKSEIAGAREVESWGGKVVRVPLVKNRSTTRVLRRLGLE